jgi:hypothetical protein
MMEEIMDTIFMVINTSWKWAGPLAVGVFGAWMIYCIVAFVCMFVDDIMMRGVDDEEL